jgi:hypothetical protein
MAEAGLRVNGKFYPPPTSFTLGEARTVKRMTGLDLSEFTKALGSLDKHPDPDVFAAFVWVSMHREDPTVTPEDVDDLDYAAIEGEGGDAAVPPLLGNASGSNGVSQVSASLSSEGPGFPSDLTPVSSGMSGSAS